MRSIARTQALGQMKGLVTLCYARKTVAQEIHRQCSAAVSFGSKNVKRRGENGSLTSRQPQGKLKLVSFF